MSARNWNDYEDTDVFQTIKQDDDTSSSGTVDLQDLPPQSDQVKPSPTEADPVAPRHNRYFHHDERVEAPVGDVSASSRRAGGLYSKWGDEESSGGETQADSPMEKGDGRTRVEEGGRRRYLYDPDRADGVWSHDKFDELDRKPKAQSRARGFRRGFRGGGGRRPRRTDKSNAETSTSS